MSEFGLKSLMKFQEKRCIFNALKLNNWDKVKTAKILEIGISTLYRKLLELNIVKPNIS